MSSPSPYAAARLSPVVVAELTKLTIASFVVQAIRQIVGIVSGAEGGALESYGYAVAPGWLLVTAGLVGLVLVVGLYLLVYIPLSKGAPWARVLGTVFAGITILGALLDVVGLLSGAFLSGFLGLAAGIVNVLWLVAAWKRR